MKLINCLKVLLTVAFVVGVLTSSNAGQKGVVLSPVTEGAKVEPGVSKVEPEKVKPSIVEPKAVPGGTKVIPIKKKTEIKQPQKSAIAEKCNGKVVTILGTSGVDFLNGTPGDDVIHGLGGNDIIRGMGGNDTICGGDGDDKLDGGKGNDTLDGGPGRDECINGPSGSRFLIAPKNCEKKATSPTVGISSKTQRKPADASGGFVPDKPAQKAQLEKQTHPEAEKKTIAAQQDRMKQRSGDTSLGDYMAESTVKLKTYLSVKLQSGDFTLWGTEWKDTSPKALKFRWNTLNIKGTNAFSGKWQISRLENFNTILFEGDAGMVPKPDEAYRWFSIDFRTWSHPAPVPVTYYVRVVPESGSHAPSPPVTVSIIKAGEDTVFNLISDVVVQPHGTYVKFFVTTTNAAKLKLRTFYGEEPPFHPSTCQEDYDYQPVWTEKSTFALGWKTEWDTHIGDLVHDSSFGWIVCAEDKDGDHYQKSGTLKTLKRRVKITFTKVDIIDDSDDLSAGECRFTFFLIPFATNYGEHAPSVEQHAYYPSKWGLVTCDSGKTVTFDPGVVFNWVGGIEWNVKINAKGFDEDGGYGSGCQLGSGDPEPLEGHKSDACGHSIGRTLKFNLRPSGLLDENISKTFQISAQAPSYVNSSLGLIFHGFLKVDYIK